VKVLPVALILALALLAIGGCATVDDGDRATLEYDCSDLVVVGRVDNLSYTPIDDPNDPLGHGVVEMDISIRRVIRGSPPKRMLRATAVAHATMVESKDFVLVLKPKQDGSFELQEANLASLRPRLISMAECSRPS
jgi:hypothetical protein